MCYGGRYNEHLENDNFKSKKSFSKDDAGKRI